MIIDDSMKLSSAQAVTTTAASTNVLDMGASGKRAGNPLFINCRVAVAATADGSATVTFAIQTCDKEDFSSGVETLYSTAAIGKAALTKDSHVFMVDIGAMKLKRYVRGYYTVATGPLTAGSFDLYAAAAVDMH